MANYKMKLTLHRHESTDQGTFGSLYIGDEKKFATVEKPWFRNMPFKSCVPDGHYKLVPFSSPKYGNVLCMVDMDGEVTKYKEVKSKRYACLIHVANYAKEVQGCIGLGKEHVGQMVTSSRASIKEFYNLVSPYEEHHLHIRWSE
jgi:hypothetical protein